MDRPQAAWDAGLVRKWLEARVQASRLDQAAADKQGYAARDDYDKAAAEEWACRAIASADFAHDQFAFARRLKELIAQDDYRATGVHDDDRFERHVRTILRRIARMAKSNEGFANVTRYQG